MNLNDLLLISFKPIYKFWVHLIHDTIVMCTALCKPEFNSLHFIFKDRITRLLVRFTS
jgi:hypothetical protein